jgi:hypothetical protein
VGLVLRSVLHGLLQAFDRRHRYLLLSHATSLAFIDVVVSESQ